MDAHGTSTRESQQNAFLDVFATNKLHVQLVSDLIESCVSTEILHLCASNVSTTRLQASINVAQDINKNWYKSITHYISYHF